MILTPNYLTKECKYAITLLFIFSFTEHQKVKICLIQYNIESKFKYWTLQSPLQYSIFQAQG